MGKYTNVASIIELVEQLSDAIALNSLLFKAAEHFFFFLLSRWVEPVKTSHKKRNQLRWTDG